MAKHITLPALGQSMEEGTIVRWIKSEGETVVEGEALYEVLTDKVSIEVEARLAGTLHKILAPVDAIIAVGAPVAIMAEPGERLEGIVESAPAGDPAKAVVSPESALNQIPGAAGSRRSRVNASPLARRLAAEHGIDLSELTGRGSGPQGRITKADVLNRAEQGKSAAAFAASAQVPSLRETVLSEPNLEYTETILSGVRKQVADAMSRSAANPHLTLTMPVDMSETVKLRKQLLPAVEKSHEVRISFTDIIALATAKALSERSDINSTVVENRIRQFRSVHLGIAVSLGSGGLIVPVVRNANALGLGALSVAIKDLATRARDGKLSADEVSGATFTITNLGTYGVAEFNPIINPPQVAILGVCAISDTVVPIDGHPEIRPIMNLCLSFDHRVIDGAPAAEFLARIKSILENPGLLIV
jgi:pyruvate dehydrogenase E2 component (dihydrolipoamide acetyltransferase)